VVFNATSVLDRLDRKERESIGRLMEWLRIPSVGTDPSHAQDTRLAAEWARDHLRTSGFGAELVVAQDPERGTQGHPVVWATTEVDSGYRGPHVLFYGHYDVQPPDPVELWESGPFEPVIREAEPSGPGERIVARGACDDKGQVATFLEAMRAIYEETGVPGGGVRYTVLLEGEEESGSVHLPALLADRRDELERCDVCLVSDTGMLGRGRPAITTGLRGLVYTELTLIGPDQDLHSGLWGGRVLNPINELARVLGALWDDDRRVAIPGFYDRVVEPSDDERRAWRDLGLDPESSLHTIGLGPEADLGEQGYTSVEREWARPTCDINGIKGGYTGPGAKTVIPSSASAKVSFRLVPEQDPARILELFFRWLDERTPPGMRWERSTHGTNPAVVVPTESSALRAASRAIERAGGVSPALVRSGGSIPVASMLKTSLGIDTIFMGFGLEDDRVHSPNEKFELDCYRLGVRSHALLTEELWSSGGS